jgi:hypothetical protein
MRGKVSCNIRCLVLSLLLLTGLSTSVFSQKTISGIINEYARVNSIGTDYVIVDDETQFHQFAAGDTVLLIQMKGVRIDAREISSFGNAGFQYGQTGAHEFLTVLSVDDVTNKIIFRNDIISSYDVLGRLQIIKVPSFNWAVVSGSPLTCQPWDSTEKIGGVLVAIFGRTLSLNANIDVSGKGFKGGSTAGGLGICGITDKWYKYAYSAFSDSAGYKGEGLSVYADTTRFGTPPFFPIYPLYAKGLGRNFNGGGGGDGWYSGGGGGSNYGLGGTGDREAGPCLPQLSGGVGGISIAATGLDGGLFLGGGGGASTFQAVGSPTAGAEGGGIVILVCDTLKGNGKSILADGAFPSVSASGNAGAGGGGGGGSIAIYLQSYTTNVTTSALTISAKGGKGGDNTTNTFGAGGGGGGGYIATSSAAIPGNVTKSVIGGTAGTRSGASNGTNGQVGKSITTFIPRLNGFLFNSIRSSVSGTQIDSICSNVVPKPLTGTSPVGGSGAYSYKWLKSLSSGGPWVEIAGATSKDYTPSVTEPVTFWIKRRVQDNVSFLLDTSKAVKIVVQQAISGNTIGKDTTICYNQNPLKLIGTGTLAGGYGNPHFHWLQNNDNNWPLHVNADGADSTKSDFDPSALTQTTYYKRKVNSGHCVDYSNIVTVTVLPLIQGNSMLSADTVICESALFHSLRASAATGGAGPGSYTFQWQDSITGSLWTDIPVSATNAKYLPDISKFNVTDSIRFYRRKVYSGPHNVCMDASSGVKLTRFPMILNNFILSPSPDTTICSGIQPHPLTASTPTLGDGNYTYQWQDSIRNGSWTIRSTAKTPYAPPALTDSTWYKRIVKASVCRSSSNIVVVNVHKPITNYNIAPDTTICYGSTPDKLRGEQPGGGDGTSYLFQWAKSTDNVTFNDIGVSGTLKDYHPSALTQRTWYKRKLVSGKCSVESNIIEVTVLPSIAGNTITPDKPAVCYNTVPGQFTATVLSGGSGAGSYTFQWQDSTAGNLWGNAAGASATQQYYTPGALTQKTWFRRIVTSGPANCCVDISAQTVIDTISLPTGTIIASPDTTICEGGDVKFKVHLTGSSPWNIVYKENSTNVTEPSVSTQNPIIIKKPSLPGASGMTQFTYTLNSVEDKNNCFATVLTGNRKADVYRVPVADAGPANDDFCGPTGYQLNAVSTDFSGIWKFPPGVISFSPSNTSPTVTVNIDPSFAPPGVSYNFYWKETNGICSDSDFIQVIFYTPVTHAYAGKDIDTMSFDHIIYLDADPVQNVYETGMWSVTAGAGDFTDESSSATEVRNVATGLNTYLWKVVNGACYLEDEVNVIISEIVIPKGISPDNYAGGNNTLVIRGLDVFPDGRHEAELSILNGAGVEVFHTTNRRGQEWKEWDGTNSQGIKLPDGTYYYLLTIVSNEYNNGKPKRYKGFIILKRQ